MQFLLFTADWCKPSGDLKQSLALLKSMRGELEVEQHDIAACPQLVQKYAVRIIPTLVRLENGRETGRKAGAIDFHELNLFTSEGIECEQPNQQA